MPTDSAPAADDWPSSLRVAVVHDWLTGMRGGEAVLEVLLDLFPRAEIFTLVHVPGSVSERIESHRIHTSRLGRLPGIARRYRWLLPLFPRAIESFDLRGFDLVLSTSHCVAKGVRPRGAPHWCYCHTPMRYVWDRFDDYFGPGRPFLSRNAAKLFRKRLQRWDVASSARVDRFIANSQYVAERIHRYWNRDADVIWPPVDIERFKPERFKLADEVEDYWLIVSALAPYKRVDIAVEAFARSGRHLIVVGKGQDESRLQRLAEGTGVELRGWLANEDVATLMARARGFLLPGEEDFGITPLEAMACGRPVVALGRGGALETVVDPRRDTERPATGAFFESPDAASLETAVGYVEDHTQEFDPLAIRRHAEGFAIPRFRRELHEDIARFLRDFSGRREP